MQRKKSFKIQTGDTDVNARQKSIKSILPPPGKANQPSKVYTIYTAPNSYVQVLYICEQLVVVNVHVDQLLWVK